MKKLLIATAIAAATASGAASAFSLQDGQTKMDIYGYIKADVYYDLNQALTSPGGSPAVWPADIITHSPTTASETNGHTTFTTQQTRLGFNFTQNTDMGAVKAKLEGDWASGGASYAYRIRHAYVEWQGVLVGQTWTNFTSWNDWADTLDWDGQLGHAGGFRQGQIRYTANVGAGSASVSLEQPTSSGIKNAGGNGKGQVPDLTARFEGKAGMLSYGVGLMGRQFKVDDPTAGGISDTKEGWGAMISTALDLGTGTTLRAGVVHGDGLGHYLYPGSIGVAGYVNASGKIETLKQTGATFAVSQAVTSNQLLTLSYGYTKTDKPSNYTSYGFTASEHEKEQNAYVTYEITPVQHLMYGLEFAHYWVDAFDGSTGHANRLQFSAKYSF